MPLCPGRFQLWCKVANVASDNGPALKRFAGSIISFLPEFSFVHSGFGVAIIGLAIGGLAIGGALAFFWLVRSKVRQEETQQVDGTNVDWREDTDPRTVNMLFATNRVPSGDPPVTNFSGERGERFSFGSASVRIPEGHMIGQIELPKKTNWLLLRFSDEPEDSKRHFILKRISVFDQEQFVNYVRDDPSRTAVVFTHGYNTSFTDGILRFAQIIFDMQFRGKGVPILFSWPSRRGILSYDYDRESANIARDFFGKLIRILHVEAGVGTIHLIGHSMGNLIMLEALSTLARLNQIPNIAEVVMAAPDVDVDHFKKLVNEIRPFARGMTLYASAKDRAILTSQQKAGKERAGSVFPDGRPVVIEQMESIDVTAIGEIFSLNHSAYATNRSLVEDIGRLIKGGLRPPHERSPQIRGVPEGAQLPLYWRYPD